VDAETWDGPFFLTAPGSPHYGLHILRYAERRQAGLIAAAEASQPAGGTLPEAKLLSHRLDFTQKRPLVGLSFIDDRPPTHHRGLWESEIALEESWAFPFLRAGASGVVGPRWPVLLQAERLFLHAFGKAIQTGAPLGWAVLDARLRVRLAFPDRSDWLAYVCFGHPECLPYLVQPGRGFTLFESLNHPENEPFVAGRAYPFRASYRTEAPVWYHGRLRLQPMTLEGGPVTVSVVPLVAGLRPQTHTLEPDPNRTAYRCLVELTMPRDTETLPLLVRFRQGGEELETLEVTLDLVEGP
jgi:hypothetical protein